MPLYNKKTKKEKRIQQLGNAIQAMSECKAKQRQAEADAEALKAQLASVRTNLKDMIESVPALAKDSRERNNIPDQWTRKYEKEISERKAFSQQQQIKVFSNSRKAYHGRKTFDGGG